MDHHRGIHVAEHAGFHQLDLAGAALLGRGSDHLDLAGERQRAERHGQRRAGARPGGGDDVVTARVSGAGEGVVFGHDRHARPPSGPGNDRAKRRGHAAHERGRGIGSDRSCRQACGDIDQREREKRDQPKRQDVGEGVDPRQVLPHHLWIGWQQLFVRIEPEHPVAGRLIDGEVSRGAEVIVPGEGSNIAAVLQREVEFVLMLLQVAAVLRPAVGQHSQERDAFRLEERQHPVIQEISRRVVAAAAPAQLRFPDRRSQCSPRPQAIQLRE